jgi:hypothetical protein
MAMVLYEKLTSLCETRHERHSLGRRGRLHELSPMCTYSWFGLSVGKYFYSFFGFVHERMGMTNVGVFVLTIVGVFIFV